MLPIVSNYTYLGVDFFYNEAWDAYIRGLSVLEQDRIWITWSWIQSGFDPDSILSALVKLLGVNRAFTQHSASAL